MRAAPPLLAGLLALFALLALPARAQDRTHAESGLVYDVALPLGWNERDPVDLLVCLHGSGDQKDTFRRALRVVVPGVRRWLCVYIQSPSAEGWPSTAVDGVAAIASAVRAERPGQGVFLLGYSAGAKLSTACLYSRPEAFDGALVAGSIGATPPPPDARVRARLLYWAVNADDPTFGGAEAVERLRGWLTDAEYDPASYVVDLRERPGLKHGLDGEAVQRGLDWLRARSLQREPATDDDRARVARVPALIAARDAAGLHDLAAPILASRRGEARALLAEALADAPKHRDAALSSAAIDLLGRLGEPRGATALAQALSRLDRDPGRYVAALRALGNTPTPEAIRALLTVLRRREGDLDPQVAAAEALARVAGRSETRALVNELEEVEDERRPRLAAALDATLREATGHDLSGGRVWRAWWEQVGSREQRGR